MVYLLFLLSFNIILIILVLVIVVTKVPYVYLARLILFCLLMNGKNVLRILVTRASSLFPNHFPWMLFAISQKGILCRLLAALVL